MVRSILHNKDAVITTLALTNLKLPTLTPEEWEEIKQACDILKPFEEVTVEISGEGYINHLLFIIIIVVIIL